MSFGNYGNQDQLKTNLTQRVCEIAILILIVLVGLSPQCGAQDLSSETFVDPTGNAMSDVKNITTPPGSNSVKFGRPKIALALGGGGMRGAAHVGVLRALVKAGIPIDMIAGTSMGAIVGGLYSAGIDVDTLAKKFADGSLMKSFMPLPLALTLVTAPVMAVPRTLEHNDYDGLYNGKKFRKYIDRTVPQYEQNIENLRIPFAAVALNLVDGKTYALTRGNLGAALQASSAVPGLREPIRIGNQLFVDGGVVDNIPVDVARSMGADIVIAVNVNERLEIVPPEGFRPVGSVTKRIVTLQLASNDAMRLGAADFVIHPNVDGIGLTSTKIKDARSAMDAGERAAWEAIPGIKEKLKRAEMLPQ
jgi:NTE family protein